jgi:predicted nucleic acid-binding protein
MITAVDTNILLDVFLPDKKHCDDSRELLKSAYNEGALIICEIVYAELAPQFSSRDELDKALNTINLTISLTDIEIAYMAGEKWGLYRKRGGTRKRIITEFLIGAHALMKADRFLTRDRGFFHSYFSDIDIMERGNIKD